MIQQLDWSAGRRRVVADEASVRWRFGLCLLFSAALHVALFGVVEPPTRPLPPPRAALTLSLAAPAAQWSSPPAPAVVAEPNPVASEPAAAKSAASVLPPAPPLSAALSPGSIAAHGPAENSPPEPARPAPPKPFAGQSALEIARALVAGLTDAPRAPRERRAVRLTDAPAQPDFAYYLEAWRRQVERVGKLNYPAEARRRKLTGSLRLLVVIRADGGLLAARLVESSGHAVLDEAALRIVRLAAPYAPFPPRIAAQADTLEIERTWRFQGHAGTLL